MIRTRIAAAALALASVATAAVVASPAHAASMSTTAEVTVVHGIPNTPVDVYVNGKITLKDFKFGKVAGPLSLAPGKYAIALRAAGAMSTAAAVLSTSVKVVAGENATIVADLTAKGKPALSVFANPTTMIPSGDTRVIVRHVAEAPGVDVYAGASKVVTDLTNPHQATLTIPAGKLSIKVDVTGTKTTVIGPASFTFAKGKTTIIYAIGNATAKPSTLTVATQSY